MTSWKFSEKVRNLKRILGLFLVENIPWCQISKVGRMNINDLSEYKW